MKIKVRQKSDTHFVGTGEDFSGELPVDAAAHVGGKGRGFRPPGLLMYSVASCMGIHTYEELHRTGKHVEGMEVETSGERREENPKVYTKILLKMRMKGADVTKQNVEDAITAALTSSCSIAVMVNMVAPITCEYQVEGGSTPLKGTITAPPAKL